MIEQRFWSKVDKSGDCWLWTAGQSNGYGVFNIDQEIIKAHRVAFRLSTGINPAGQCVLHSCDNPLCVNPDHLRLGDRADNSDDKVSRNRQCRGESRPLSKLTESIVRHIRKSRKGTCELARELHVSPAAVSMARNGRTWRHVE